MIRSVPQSSRWYLIGTYRISLALVEVTATDSLRKAPAWTSLRKPKLDSKIEKGLRFDVIVCTACKRGLHAKNR